MRSLVGLMVGSLIILFVGYSGWMHFRNAADSAGLQANAIAERVKAAETYNEVQDPNQTQDPNHTQDPNQTVTVVGPLAQFMNRMGGKFETIKPVYKATASDRVGGSVVGTTSNVLQQTFAVAGAVDLPFEVPVHAYSPKFHGTFRSFIQASGAPSTAPGDVEFLLLSEQQFSAFMEGHPSEALFSADAAHDQEVNVNLPPTLDQPSKYHLIFRNVSPKTGKRVVKADFQIDF